MAVFSCVRRPLQGLWDDLYFVSIASRARKTFRLEEHLIVRRVKHEDLISVSITESSIEIAIRNATDIINLVVSGTWSE